MVPEIERAPSEAIKNLQEAKLKEMLHYLNENSPFYKRFFKTHKVRLNAVNTLADLQKIPVTTKDHLQQFNDI